jgi:hypothetical protein
LFELAANESEVSLAPLMAMYSILSIIRHSYSVIPKSCLLAAEIAITKAVTASFASINIKHLLCQNNPKENPNN